MATTIRALLAAADTELDEARMRVPSALSARDAAGVIAAAGRILEHLNVDAQNSGEDGPREVVVAGLVAACERVGDHGGQAGRATALIGAAGDAIGRLHRDSTNADRWALIVSVASLTRKAAAVYAETGPALTPPSLGAVRYQATAIARLGVLNPPDARDVAIQDYPISTTELTDGLSPLGVSAESAQLMTALVHRAATRDAPPLAVYEMKGVARAMQSVTDYAAAIGLALTENAEDPEQPDIEASEPWSRVRQSVGVFHDGQRPDRHGPEPILRAAVSIHDGLFATFGPPDQITAAAAALDPAHAELLLVVVAQVPQIAAELRLHTDRLPGRWIARAHDLPVVEARVGEFLKRLPILARPDDFVTVRAALNDAGVRSARLAEAIESSPRLASGSQEPLLPASYLAGRFQPDLGPALHRAVHAQAPPVMERRVSTHPAAVVPER